jgi:hypothetical protein
MQVTLSSDAAKMTCCAANGCLGKTDLPLDVFLLTNRCDVHTVTFSFTR